MGLDDESLNGNALINGTSNEVALKNCFRMVILGIHQDKYLLQSNIYQT